MEPLSSMVDFNAPGWKARGSRMCAESSFLHRLELNCTCVAPGVACGRRVAGSCAKHRSVAHGCYICGCGRAPCGPRPGKCPIASTGVRCAHASCVSRTGLGLTLTGRDVRTNRSKPRPDISSGRPT